MFNILLIEDSAVFREVEVALLKKIDNCTIQIAVNYKECLMKVDQSNFDLIICDIHLPDGNGLDILDYVRENNNKGSNNLVVPFIMVTGDNDMDVVKDCIKKGVTHYLVKPLQPAKFLKACCQSLSVPLPKY